MAGALRARPDVVANHIVTVDGRVVGGWRRLEAKGTMTVETTLVARLDSRVQASLRAAAARLQAFLGQPVKLVAAPRGNLRASR